MLFLGIDPGYGRLGYGIVSDQPGVARPAYVTAGVIETSGELGESARLLEIEKNLMAILGDHPCKFAAVEQVFFTKNLTTGVQLIQARGIALLCLEKNGIGHVAVSPTSVKKLLTGSGKATKKQVETILKKFLGLTEIPGPDDASDGLTLAIYAWLQFRSPAHKLRSGS